MDASFVVVDIVNQHYGVEIVRTGEDVEGAGEPLSAEKDVHEDKRHSAIINSRAVSCTPYQNFYCSHSTSDWLYLPDQCHLYCLLLFLLLFLLMILSYIWQLGNKSR